MKYGYKKFGKRMLALILGALLTAGLMTGCSGNGSSSANTSGAANNPGGEDGVFTIALSIILLVALMVIVVDQITGKLRKELLK